MSSLFIKKVNRDNLMSFIGMLKYKKINLNFRFFLLLQ